MMGGFFKDVLDGKVRDVRRWVEKGQQVGVFDEHGNTALQLAAERGYRGVCKVLIDAGADVNKKNLSVGWTAVHYAAYEGHSDVLRMLIAHGAIPDLKDNSGDTAESYAKEWENTECLTILQEAVALREARSKMRTTKSSSDEMFDSDDKTLSDESEEDEEDEDESSMMNWVIPPPSLPSTNIIVNQTNLVNNLVNNQFSKTVDNLSLDTMVENKHNTGNPQNTGPTRTGDNDKTKDKIFVAKEDNVSITREDQENENNQRKEIEMVKHSQDLEIPDVVLIKGDDKNLEDIEEKSCDLTSVTTFDDEDTESEDTLKLLRKTTGINVMRETTPSKHRTSSIVDRIKSTLSPAPQLPPDKNTKDLSDESLQLDIDKFLDMSIGDEHYKQTTRNMWESQREKNPELESSTATSKQSTEQNKEKVEPNNMCQKSHAKTETPVSRSRPQCQDQVCTKEGATASQQEVHHRRERSVARALSQAREIIARERSATRGPSQVRDVTGQREMSQVREMTIPRELMPLADHIFSMSSATIPDDMTMSCGSIFDRFGDLEGGESEKEILLRRLKELIDVEEAQVREDIEQRRKQLAEAEEQHRNKTEKVKANHEREEQEMVKRHKQERETMQARHSAEEERIKGEMTKLEEELESMIAPSLLLSSLTSTQKSPSVAKVVQVKPELSELEQELQCCGCGKVCHPPTKIYQCPEGDLICDKCKGGGKTRLETCPACKVELAGMISRNKVLENIAKKYFLAS